MKRAGRKSAEAKAALTLIDVSQFRPEPPSYLTEEQQGIWAEIVGSMKPQSFPPSVWPLLAQYCVHVAQARLIAAQLRRVDLKKDLKLFRTWLTMQRAESNIMCQLATKLRLLPKTNTRAERQQTDASGAPWNIRRRPWEGGDDTPAA